MTTNSEQHGPSSQSSKPNLASEVKRFYKDDFKNMFLLFFKNPIDGIYTLFLKPSEKSFSQALIIFISVFLLYLIGGFALFGKEREYMNLMDFLKMSAVPVVTMFLISVLSFSIKSFSGKANFKDELFTGGLCGIPLSLFVIVLLVLQILSSKNVVDLIEKPQRAGVVGILLFFYLSLMMINVFQQSLKASGIRAAIAWYISPFSVLLSAFIAVYVIY